MRLRLPWDPSNVTIGDMVHGGAIAALADVAVMAAAWAGADVPDSLRGVTTSMAMQFLAPARATDLIAIGRVLRRGKTHVNIDVDVVTSGRRRRREGDRDLQNGVSRVFRLTDERGVTRPQRRTDGVPRPRRAPLAPADPFPVAAE